jgi:hypothetical protein
MAEPSTTSAIRSLNTDFSADQTSTQSHQHPAHFVNAVQGYFSGWGVKPLQFPCHLNVRRKLICRSQRNVKEPGEFPLRAPTASFGDVGRYRGGRAPGLLHKSKPLAAGIRSRERVDIDGQLLALLPNLELPEVVHESAIHRTPDHLKNLHGERLWSLYYRLKTAYL